MKNKLLMVLLSALLSFGIWYYVVTVISPEHEETYYQVPVVFEGESLLSERGLMITENRNPTVTLTLIGNRTDLGQLNSTNIKVTADLSKIGEAGEQRVNFTVTYPSDKLTGAIQVVNKNPKYITLFLEEQITKDIDVRVKYTGSVPESYLADQENVVLDNKTVRITGPKTVIERIESARIDVDMTDRIESFSEKYRYTLCDEAGEPVDAKLVQTNVAQINLTMKIQRFKEIPLRLTVVSGGGATEQTSEIKIEPPTIKVSGSEKTLESLSELNLGTINLAEITSDTTQSFPIELPPGLTNLSGVSEAVVTIRFPDLASKTLTVTKFTAIHVPEGMEAEIISQEMQITLRGPKKLMQILDASKLTITVDCSSLQLGTVTVKPQIQMARGYEAVGAVGTYSVTVTLREKGEENEATGQSAVRLQ